MPFTLRLDLMKQSHQISELTHQKMTILVDFLKENLIESQWGLATTFVTHSAIALQRTLNQSPLEIVDETIVEDVQSRATFDQAKCILNAIQIQINVEFNRPESTLILAHLCSLLEKIHAD